VTANTSTYLELWSDSFHEGDWAVDHITRILKTPNVNVTMEYVKGFIPRYQFRGPEINLCITVFGSYRSWTRLPKMISDMLDWGKPDLILYDPESKRILFSVEETAAVPTGNQSLQRCERMYGALRISVPFWYLITEFGMHVDGGVRRDSIWPTIMALKLTRGKKTPCVVLHYSDIDNPEDYSTGKGLESLFNYLGGIVANFAKGMPVFDGIEDPLSEQFADMLRFVKDQWGALVDFLPGSEKLDDADLPKLYARTAINQSLGTYRWPVNFLIWPQFDALPRTVQAGQIGKQLIKEDPLCEIFEKHLSQKKAYTLSNRTGSRPQPGAEIAKWITKQRRLFNSGGVLEPHAEYTVKPSDFPKSKSGLYHVTTAKNIVYLYNRWGDVQDAIESAFPRLKRKITGMDPAKPTLVYISNSLKPGRIFGDPFTGQIAAFATIFGKLDPEPRYVLAYFPHQAYTQAIAGEQDKSNKGLTLMRELTDMLLFGGGVAVALQSNTVL